MRSIEMGKKDESGESEIYDGMQISMVSFVKDMQRT